MSTTSTGQAAERLVADYLTNDGYIIKARNWKTKWCEIDIVALKDGVTYFVEVKYRSQNNWGDGFEYITPTKLRQMAYAAELYASRDSLDDYCLAACAVDDTGAIHMEMIEI